MKNGLGPGYQASLHRVKERTGQSYGFGVSLSLMGRTAKTTVATVFAPDVMEALLRFRETVMPEASLAATVQELVIVGLSRSIEEGVESAVRRRVAREVKRWAFQQLGQALNEMLGKVDETAAALSSEGADEINPPRQD